jgi:hypothetical protein
MTELAIKNRIALLQSRPKENYNIIKKLQRKLRKLEETKQND